MRTFACLMMATPLEKQHSNGNGNGKALTKSRKGHQKTKTMPTLCSHQGQNYESVLPPV
jgi:hypothetical protein